MPCAMSPLHTRPAPVKVVRRGDQPRCIWRMRRVVGVRRTPRRIRLLRSMAWISWPVGPGGCGPGCAARRWRSRVVAVSPAAPRLSGRAWAAAGSAAAGPPAASAGSPAASSSWTWWCSRCVCSCDRAPGCRTHVRDTVARRRFCWPRHAGTVISFALRDAFASFLGTVDCRVVASEQASVGGRVIPKVLTSRSSVAFELVTDACCGRGSSVVVAEDVVDDLNLAGGDERVQRRGVGRGRTLGAIGRLGCGVARSVRCGAGAARAAPR